MPHGIPEESLIIPVSPMFPQTASFFAIMPVHLSANMEAEKMG